MNISRDLALEIFGLTENASKEDILSSYRKLAKIAHPDKGGDNSLFAFINECKKVLDCEGENSTNSNQNVSTRKTYYITLDYLYSYYYHLDYDTIEKKHLINDIRAYVKISIHPLFRKSMLRNYTLSVESPFQDFLNFDKKLLDLSQTILLPKEFRKFNIFKVRVRLLDKTYKFYIFNNSLRTIKYTPFAPGFTTLLNLLFKNSDDI